MSVLIKDMVMPTGCYDCPFRVDVNLGVGIADGCNAITAMISNPAERLPDCPLVPVPPHGDLIDRDEQIERAWRLNLSTRELIEEMLKSAHTIVPAEESE